MKGVKPLVLISATILTISTFAQQGIFYYVNTNQDLVNSKTVDAILNDNGLVVLNECANAKYENPAIQIIELNKSFIKTSENIVKVDNMDNVSGFSKLGNGNYSVFVNANADGSVPVQVLVSSGYKNLEQNKFSDHQQELFIDDASVNDKVFALSTHTIEKGKFEIVLTCFDANSGKKQWTKNVSNEANESADAIVADNLGNVVVLGRKYSDNGTDYIPILYKLNDDGGIVWKKSGVDMPSNFYSQTISANKNGDIYYACGLTQRANVLQTKVIKLDANGNTKRTININEFTSNGSLILASGKLLLYGSRFHTDSKQVVTKGSYVILDSDLDELSNKTLAVDDKPDSDFKYSSTSSSDLQAAVELESGSIVMIGKVTMPQAGGTEKQNNTIVVVADAFGNYK